MGDSAYPCVYDADRVAIIGRGKVFVSALDDFAEGVYARLQVRAVVAHMVRVPKLKCLQAAVSKIYPPSVKVYSRLMLQRIRHSAYAAMRSSLMQGRDVVAASLVERLMAPSDGTKPALVLSGVPGMGKSAVIGEVVQELEQRLTAKFDSSAAGAALRKREEEQKRRAERRARKAAKAKKGKKKGDATPKPKRQEGEFKEPRTIAPGVAMICHLVGSTTRSGETRAVLQRLVLELRAVVKTSRDLAQLAGRHQGPDPTTAEE